MPKETFKQMWYRLNRGLSWKGKVKNKRSDGSFYWVYANVEPLFTSKGNIDSFVSIRLDITESELLHYKIQEEEKKNKWHEEMIREQSRLVQMGEMISMIAHQWRQPLSAIAAASGSLQLKAKRNRLDQDTAIEIADKIKSFSLHLSSTIDDFRNFFKTNKTKKATNFKTVLTSVLSIIEGSLEENKVIFNVTVKGNDDFQTFENELKQVILNLIKNAEDALLDNKIKNPQIDILIENSKFTIYDNAGGIPEDIIDKIFDPYFSTKTKKDGTGLGLYMSKMIIEDHCKGKIAVTNENDGAKFQITLGELNG
jgi:signal transduction histidine kinase